MRDDPKWIKTPTSSDVQSKGSQNSSSFDVSDTHTNIDLNGDIDEISDDVEEISPPRRSVGPDKSKRDQHHADEAGKGKRVGRIEREV